MTAILRYHGFILLNFQFFELNLLIILGIDQQEIHSINYYLFTFLSNSLQQQLRMLTKTLFARLVDRGGTKNCSELLLN